MDAACFKAIKTIATNIGCKWRIKNEDGNIIDVNNQASKVIFDDTNERFYAIRTNQNNAYNNNDKFRITCAMYNCAKLIDLDVDIDKLMAFCEEIGTDWEDIEDFVNSTTMASTNRGGNFNKDENGKDVFPTSGPVVEV